MLFANLAKQARHEEIKHIEDEIVDMVRRNDPDIDALSNLVGLPVLGCKLEDDAVRAFTIAIESNPPEVVARYMVHFINHVQNRLNPGM